jgi:hypothetical protein
MSDQKPPAQVPVQIKVIVRGQGEYRPPPEQKK